MSTAGSPAAGHTFNIRTRRPLRSGSDMALTSFQSHSSRKNLLFEHIRLGGGGETGFPLLPCPRDQPRRLEMRKPGFPFSRARKVAWAGASGLPRAPGRWEGAALLGTPFHLVARRSRAGEKALCIIARDDSRLRGVTWVLGLRQRPVDRPRRGRNGL